MRRNHSKHYEKKSATSNKNKNSGRKSASYSRKRKNTRESFGKNFFDF